MLHLDLKMNIKSTSGALGQTLLSKTKEHTVYDIWHILTCKQVLRLSYIYTYKGMTCWKHRAASLNWEIHNTLGSLTKWLEETPDPMEKIHWIIIIYR